MKEKTEINKNGLYDNVGLIKTLGVDLNNLVKHAFSGNYVAFCGVVYQMFNKITNIETGVRNDTESLEKQVADLQRFVDDINDAKGESDV